MCNVWWVLRLKSSLVCRHVFGVMTIVLWSSGTAAALQIEGPTLFREQVDQALKMASERSLYLHRLIDSLVASPVLVTVRPITDDPVTWHHSGNRNRSHTRPLDSLSRSEQRNRPTASVVYLNPSRIRPNHRSFTRGTLVHELVHALDLATGRYHGDYVVRERRAVLFQNLWRDALAVSPRSDYHERFVTLEFQIAKQRGNLSGLVDHYFSANDLP